MEDGDKRSTIFTVQNAEKTIVTFFWIVLVLIISVCIHGWITTKTLFGTFLFLSNNVTKIVSGATLLLLLLEGVYTMFLWRLRTERRKLKQEKEKKAEELAKAKAEGKAEYAKRINEWDERRRAAEARGEKFTEPPPAPE